MPSYFPCPNAQCNYQFDANILPAAAMVTCPLCRTKFPYRANRLGSAPGPEESPPDEVNLTGHRLISVRDVPKGGGIWMTILWVAGFCIVLGGVVAIVVMRGRPPVESNSDVTDAKFNIKVEQFPQPWDSNSDAMKPPSANILGRKRSDPDAWIAVAARDWKDRQPRNGELDELMRTHLKGNESSFANIDFEPVEGQTWAGLPALSVRFSGTLDDAQIRGQAFAISYKGIGYAFYAWSAEGSWASVGEETISLREKIKPANYRDNWVEKHANTQIHTVDGADYQVEDSDGAWVRAKPAAEWDVKDRLKYPIEDVKEIDPAATMAFRAEYRIREGGDNKRRGAQASALVVELPGGGDPLEAAKSHVIESIKKEYPPGMVPEITLEPMTRSPAGIALPSGSPVVARFLFRNPQDREDRVMYVISALAIGSKTVAVETHASEINASYVEEWMVHLAGSLKAK